MYTIRLETVLPVHSKVNDSRSIDILSYYYLSKICQVTKSTVTNGTCIELERMVCCKNLILYVLDLDPVKKYHFQGDKYMTMFYK